MPEIVRAKYNSIMERIERIELDQGRRQDGEAETSFIDNNDGKTVTIKGPCGRSLEVDTAKFVGTVIQDLGYFSNIEDQVYDILNELIIADDTSVFDEEAYENTMRRLMRRLKDQGRNFESDLLQEVHNRLDIRRTRSAMGKWNACHESKHC